MTESMIGLGVGTGFVAFLLFIANWRIFKKAGIPGWLSLVPVYNMYLQYKICWKGWIGIFSFMLYTIITVLSYIQADIMIIAAVSALSAIIQTIFCFKLAKAFGKGFFMGLILAFTAGFGRIILGLGRSKYRGCIA